MSESNGHGESLKDIRETLQAVTASHVKLMTDHALFVKEQERAWERHASWVREQDERHAAWVREQDVQSKARGERLDERIAELVSAKGTFIAAKSKTEGSE